MALVDQNITSTWTLDARQLIGELERTKGAMGGVEQAAQRTTAAADRFARSSAGIRDQMRPMGEQMEKIRTAFGLAGLSMQTAAGAGGAWVQAAVKIIAQGGLVAGAITGIGIAVGKLVEHLQAAEDAQRRLLGAIGAFGITSKDVEAVQQAFEGVTKQQAIAIATTAAQAGVARDEIAKLAGLARLEAMRTGQDVDQAFAAVVRMTGDGTQRAVEGAQARIREIRQEILSLNREIARLEARGFGRGAISPLEARRDELLAEGELLRQGQEGQGLLANRAAAQQLDRASARSQAAGVGQRARSAGLPGGGIRDETFEQFQERIQGDVFEEQAREQIEREKKLADDIFAVNEEGRKRERAARQREGDAQKREDEALHRHKMQIAEQYFDILGGGITNIAMAFASGSAAQTKAALESIAAQAAVEAAFMAAKALFIGVIDPIDGPTRATVAFQAAAAMAGVAALAGGASAAVRVPSGGGRSLSGSVGGTSRPEEFGPTAESPVVMLTEEEARRRRARAEFEIHFHHPVFNTEREVDDAFGRIIKRTRRRGFF